MIILLVDVPDQSRRIRQGTFRRLPVSRRLQTTSLYSHELVHIRLNGISDSVCTPRPFCFRDGSKRRGGYQETEVGFWKSVAPTAVFSSTTYVSALDPELPLHPSMLLSTCPCPQKFRISTVVEIFPLSSTYPCPARTCFISSLSKFLFDINRSTTCVWFNPLVATSFFVHHFHFMIAPIQSPPPLPLDHKQVLWMVL
jgi:hypothetical protein